MTLPNSLRKHKYTSQVINASYIVLVTRTTSAIEAQNLDVDLDRVNDATRA